MTDRALVDACKAVPDDDGPRLVWADAIGGERGELVVIQCDLARGGLSPAESAARRKRQRELLQAHGAAWSGLAGIATRCLFRRGFVEAVEIDGTTLVEHHEQVLAAAPLLTTLTVSGLTYYTGWMVDDHGAVALELIPKLIETRVFERVSGLHIAEAYTSIQVDSEFNPHDWEPHGDAVIEMLAAAGVLPHLRAFAITNSGMGKPGSLALWSERGLSAVERLWLPDWTGGPQLARVPKLVALELRNPGGLDDVPAAVVELVLGGIHDASLAALAKHPAAATLERLSLHHGGIARDAGPLAAFPRLRSLDLTDVTIGFAGYPETHLAAMRTWTSQPMPALRELRGIAHSRVEPMHDVVAAYGAQLELFDNRSVNSWRFPAELASRIAGELRLGDWEQLPRLLHVGGRAPEPWLDPPVVKTSS